jgi:tetratricopeptide (TPR) repeat protein
MVFFLLMSISGVALGDYKKLTEKGNEAYTKSNMEEALKLYREAEIERPKQPVLDYNIGTALYNQNKYDEALQRYGKAVFSDDPKFQTDAFYNMGSTFFRAEKYQEAIAAFQKCLETSPDDVDAKYNLELARKKLKEQAKQQEQKQDKNQQQKQDQQQQDQKKQEQQDQQKDQQQQQDQDQQKQQEQQQQEQQQQGEDKQKQDQQSAGEKEDQQKEQEQQQKQGQQQKEGMSKQDAERILNAISGDEKDLQKKMRRVKVNAAYKGKDW